MATRRRRVTGLSRETHPTTGAVGVELSAGERHQRRGK